MNHLGGDLMDTNLTSDLSHRLLLLATSDHLLCPSCEPLFF